MGRVDSCTICVNTSLFVISLTNTNHNKMKNFNFLIVAGCLFLATNAVQSQEIIKNTVAHIGISFLEQDRRLFEYPNSDDIIENENTELDWEANIFMQREWLLSKRLGFNAGVGYSQYHSYFSRPYDKAALTGARIITLEGTYVGHYRIDRLSTPISINCYLTKKRTLFVNLLASSYFNLKKKMKDKVFDRKYKRWNFQFNGIEINPGLGFKLKKLTFQCNYRWFNLVRLDRVIFDSSLFNYPNPPFLQKKYDDYNPTKISFTVGYSLSE